MRHYYEILSYDTASNAHVCADEKGTKHRIDLMVNGDLDEKNPEALIGKRVSVDYTYACVSIGMGVKIES